MYTFLFQILTLLPIPSRGYGIDQVKIRDTTLNLSKQLIVVVTGGWDSLQGKLYCFNMHHGKWMLQFANPVVVGKRGLGIGDGLGSPLSEQNHSPVKKEGDLRSPAGIFSIGAAFGYASRKEAGWIRNDYIDANETLICVDDPRSIWYNVLVNSDSVKQDWSSFEQMHRKDDYYQWGLFINHNAKSPKPNVGSCIFMHIWKNDHEGTDGCTAMDKDDMVRLLHWINSGLHPVLIQMPENEYHELASHKGLPEINFR
jgi:L,D-peptidoglycan transpeptidase YkuD (ErfK/YbiS/YcfS/YnhG family)